LTVSANLSMGMRKSWMIHCSATCIPPIRLS
jgi:hypothetical protein